jgi:PAS domain S-box-containing protein
MQLIQSLSRVFHPKSLGIQIVLPVFLLLLPAAGLFAWFTISSLADEQRHGVIDKVVHVGETFRTLPLGFTGQANREVENFLLLATESPIAQIAIVDKHGDNIVAATKPHSGKAYLNETPQNHQPPVKYSSTRMLSSDGLAYWLPIKSVAGKEYWLTVNASLQDINDWEYARLLTTFGALFILFAILVPLAILKARKLQKVMRDAAEFANTITSNPNSELVSHSDSEELNNLVGALNRISKHWYHRLQISEQHAAYLRMHKAAIDLHSAVCITNVNGRIEYVNKHFCIASGYDETELIGRKISLLNSGYHEDYFFKTLWRTLTVGRVWQGDLCNRHKSGVQYWVKCTIAPIKNQAGHLCQYIAVQTPLTQASDVEQVALVK